MSNNNKHTPNKNEINTNMAGNKSRSNSRNTLRNQGNK